jgi:hypothetical protein
VLRETRALGTSDLVPEPDALVIAQSRGWTIAFHGHDAQHFVGYQIMPDGSLGQVRRASFDHVASQIAAGDTGLLQIWARLHDIAPPAAYGANPGWQDTTGQAFGPAGSLFLISARSDALHLLSPTGQGRSLGTDLGIGAPVGLLLLPDAGAGARLVLAGAATSSLSVFRAQASGYVPTDHVIDTARTAFGHVQALHAAQVPTARGPLDLVLAGGGDHGITLFALTPAGRLIWLDTFFDTAATGLHNVTALSSIVQGGRLVVLATSERDAGVSVLHLPLANLGGLVLDGRGAACDDIVLGAATAARLTGGAGADVFVILAMAARMTITDFTPGQDRIDLSDWPMLRDMGQLVVTPRADGAQITYRDNVLVVQSSTGRPLDAASLFPTGLAGPDRVMPGAVTIPPDSSDPLPPDSPPDLLPPAQPCTIAALRAALAGMSASANPAATGEAGQAVHVPPAGMAVTQDPVLSDPALMHFWQELDRFAPSALQISHREPLSDGAEIAPDTLLLFTADGFDFV